MSLYDYHLSQVISEHDHPVDALLMAAMRKSDSYNLARFEAAFPELLAEMKQRYNAPGGVIPEDGNVDMDAVSMGKKAMRKRCGAK